MHLSHIYTSRRESIYDLFQMFLSLFLKSIQNISNQVIYQINFPNLEIVRHRN